MTVNLHDAELAARDDEGHRFHRLFLGEPAGAERTGFAVYELAPGEKAWPYHYELSEEEWLFVIEGELVLRTPTGNSNLRAGEVVCFPVGPEGAHQMWNDSAAPVRFAMASAGTEGRAYVAIRPDSNTAYIEGPGFFQIVPLEVSMEYWEREPWNLFDLELKLDDDDPDGYHTFYRRLAPELGGVRIAFNVFELPPGQSVCPYHYESTEEEWIVVLTGRPTVRTPEGETELRPWDCVFCPAGEAGAHKVTNHGDEPARIVIWSNRSHPGTTVYPDSNKVGAWPPGKLFRLDDAVDYFDGEVE